MKLGLVIVHVIISVVLVVVVLMQHGKQQGLSGSIAGGAETFFGKNKGRTIDAMLKKFTAVLALLFVASSIVLTTVSVNEYKNTSADTATTEATDEGMQLQTDADGNVIDADGNILMTADELAQQMAASGENAENAENAEEAADTAETVNEENATAEEGAAE